MQTSTLAFALLPLLVAALPTGQLPYASPAMPNAQSASLSTPYAAPASGGAAGVAASGLTTDGSARTPPTGGLGDAGTSLSATPPSPSPSSPGQADPLAGLTDEQLATYLDVPNNEAHRVAARQLSNSAAPDPTMAGGAADLDPYATPDFDPSGASPPASPGGMAATYGTSPPASPGGMAGTYGASLPPMPPQQPTTMVGSPAMAPNLGFGGKVKSTLKDASKTTLSLLSAALGGASAAMSQMPPASSMTMGTGMGGGMYYR